MGGSPVGDGTPSLDSFNASAAALVKRWKEIEVDDSLPDWTWKPCSKMGAPSEVSAQCFFSLLLYPPLLALQFALVFRLACALTDGFACFLAGRGVSSTGRSVPRLWREPGV